MHTSKSLTECFNVIITLVQLMDQYGDYNGACCTALT